MFIFPYGAPEGYEWFVTLVVLVGLSLVAISCGRGADLVPEMPDGSVVWTQWEVQ